MSRTPVVTLGIAAETTITVTRRHSTTMRPQGLILDADQPLRVGETSATRVVLWSTNSPEEVEVVTTDAGELRIWNVWRDGDLIQAWERDAGLEVDDAGADLGLRCHDGHGGDEVALDVNLSFDRAWTQPTEAG